MKMHDNIPSNWRTCMGALQTRARAKKDPQEGQKWPRYTSTVSADMRSATKVSMLLHKCAHLCKPLRLGYTRPPCWSARGRARSRITHRQRALSRKISPSVNARPRYASGREMVTVHGRSNAHLLTHRQDPSALWSKKNENALLITTGTC